jgi:cytochrome P450
VYYLGHYPEVKQRLQEELDAVLGTKPITYGDLDKLQYCEAIIKEVNRHFPVNFTVGRVNAEQDVVGGFSWPKGTSFSIFYPAIMKRKDYWTDPEKFDPDRFYKIDESDKYLLEKQYAKNAFTLFGSGIRFCPGKKLAMLELKCILASIYRKYDVELVDKNAPIKYNSMIVTACKELIVKIKPRKF